MSYECAFCSRVLTTERGLIAHTEAKHGRTGTHRAMRAWERGRDQVGEVTLGGGACADATYEVDSDDSCYDSGTDTWSCDFCYKEFAERAHLLQHLNSGVHEESRYHCKGCSKSSKLSVRCNSTPAAQLAGDTPEGLFQLPFMIPKRLCSG